jgi:hypothetical protein
MTMNLIPLIPKRTEMERTLIADAMYDYDPGKLDYSDLRVMALLSVDRVIAALRNFYWVHGTVAALALAHKLECERRTHPGHETPGSMTTEI